MAENNQESPALRIAECCGNCRHVSRPKAPAEPHEAHYNVAKTERWCYKYNRHITRETVCDGFELEPKKGGAAACKRAFAFNKKVEEINEIRDRMKRLGIDYALRGGNRRFSILPDRPYVLEEEYVTAKFNHYKGEMEPCDPHWENYLVWGPKEQKTKELIKEIKEALDKIEKEKEGK